MQRMTKAAAMIDALTPMEAQRLAVQVGILIIWALLLAVLVHLKARPERPEDRF